MLSGSEGAKSITVNISKIIYNISAAFYLKVKTGVIAGLQMHTVE